MDVEVTASCNRLGLVIVSESCHCGAHQMFSPDMRLHPRRLCISLLPATSGQGGAACRKLGSSTDLGPRLRRGYLPPQEGATSQQVDTKAEAADDAAAKQPVERLLLVVHGIGQNLSGTNSHGCHASQ